MTETSDETSELMSFLYACPVGLAEMTADGAIGMINPLAMQLLIPLSAAPSLNFFALMEPYAPELLNLLAQFDEPKGTVCDHLRILISPETAGRAAKVYSCTLIKLGADRFMIALDDISTQVKHERKLKEAETWFSSLLDGPHDFGVASLDAQGRIESVNESVVQQTGYRTDELIGQTLDVFNTSEKTEASLDAEQQISLASKEGWYLNETWQEQKDGVPYWCQRLIAVRREEEEALDRFVSGYTVIFRKGEQRSIDIHRLKHMLTRDHLTDTYNRMHFFEIAERECSRKIRYDQSLSLIAIDIDNFKRVNDDHGHACGDAVLKAVASRCMELLRPSDIMARIGGEEFVILLPSTDLRGALQLAERLRSAVDAVPIQTCVGPLHLTGSFGCVEMRSNTCKVAELMALADKALYEAKHAGRNCVISGGVI